MCLPEHNSQYNRGCNRRTLLMAGLGFGIILVIIVIIALVTTSSGDPCMDNLQCLPINECEGHLNPDFAYGCGSHDSPMICCIPKKNQTSGSKSNATLANSRYLKKDLLPLNNCGISDLEDRIAGGINATIGQFPWNAVLYYSQPGLDFRQALCGGTLISDRYVLTAAHCIHNDNPTLELTHVRLGDVNLNEEQECISYETGDKECSVPVEIRIQYAIEHEKHNKTDIKNDIALLRLEEPVKFTDFIKPICLPYGIAINETYFQSRNFTISGWGKTNPSDIGVHHLLQYTLVSPWEKEECEKELKFPYKPLLSSQVCASGGANIQEACQGDSGGPMTFEYHNGPKIRSVQIGITSFKSVNTCGSERVPTIYTRVDSYLDWILDHIEK